MGECKVPVNYKTTTFEMLVYFASINMSEVRRVGQKHPKYTLGVRVHSDGSALWRAGPKHLSSERKQDASRWF